MVKKHVIQAFDDISIGLRSPNLKQALYNEGSVIMKDTLLTLHGAAHRKRRLLELKVFRKNFFDLYEKNIFPNTLHSSMRSDFESGYSELVDLSYRVTMNLTADFAGIDRPDQTAQETLSLLNLVETFSEGATIVHSTRAKDEVILEVEAAIGEFKPKFLNPSIKRRRLLLERYDRKEITEAELPRDVLTVILQHGDPEEFTEEMLTREIAFYLQAGAHSTANSTVHAFHEISNWAEAQNGRWKLLRDDPIFFQRAVHESFRLHPASPVAWRTAACPLRLNEVGEIKAGHTVEFCLAEANRDVDIFGFDAEEFNPERRIKGSVPPFGHTFGTGVHACLGRELDGGALPREDSNPETHQYGIVTLFLRELFDLGAKLDPDRALIKASSTKRPNWGHYPITFQENNKWS